MPGTRDGRPVTGAPLRFADEVLDRRHDDDAVAVVDVGTEEQVSYRTLGRRVQALTDRLAPLVGRHDTVALVMDKSIDAVVGMLAALRLGRRAIVDPDAVAHATHTEPAAARDAEATIELFATDLAAYQDATYAESYRAFVATTSTAERAVRDMKEAIREGRERRRG